LRYYSSIIKDIFSIASQYLFFLSLLFIRFNAWDFLEDAGNRENKKRERKTGQSKEFELFNHGNFGCGIQRVCRK